MSISFEINKNFLAALFEKDQLVSAQLPTFNSDAENAYKTVKNLVIVAPYLDEKAEQEQLDKILSVCKLHTSDFAIHMGNCSWASLRHYQNIRNVLLFGVLEKNIDISFEFNENQIVSFDDRSWIKTYALSRLLKDGAAKNTLWQHALKPLYIG